MGENPDTPVTPLVTPTRTILVVLVLLSLGAGVAMIALLGDSRPAVVAGFFLLSLGAAVVTFGLLGASGVFEGFGGKLAGSAAVLIILFLALMSFVPEPTRLITLTGTLKLDGTPVTDATVALSGSDSRQHTYEVTDEVPGFFRLSEVEPREAYELFITIAGYETSTASPLPDADGRLHVSFQRDALISAGEPDPPDPDAVSEEQLVVCSQQREDATVFLFDYIDTDVDPNELRIFLDMNHDRLRSSLLHQLGPRRMLEEISFRVVRCSKAEIYSEDRAQQAAQLLKVPVVFWGHLQKDQNGLRSLLVMTCAEDPPVTHHMPESIGQDVTGVLGLRDSLGSEAVAVAALIVGDAHARAHRFETALRAYTVAEENAGEFSELVPVIKARIEQTLSQVPAAGLAPLGS